MMARTSSSVTSVRSASCSSSHTTVVVSGFSRTSVSLDGDIDFTALFFNRHALQPDRLLRRVRSCFDRELVAVPRADNAHFGFVEAVTRRDLLVVDDFADRGNDQSLAHRAAHMGARVFVRVETSADAEDAHRLVADVEHEAAVVWNAVAAPGQMAQWCRGSGCHSSLMISEISGGSQMGNFSVTVRDIVERDRADWVRLRDALWPGSLS